MSYWLVFALVFALGSNCILATEDDSIAVADEGGEQIDSDVSEHTLAYQSPYADPSRVYLAEHFDDENKFNTKWVKSTAKKDDLSDETAKYDGVWQLETANRPILKGDLGLVLKSKAKHAAISARLSKPFVFSDQPFIVQYEVQLQDGQECGGSYIKLLSSGRETTDLKNFNDKTPYTIMFGPDKCGNDIKLHFIFRHVNPINKTISEKHCRKSKERIEEPFKDKQPHLYQLILNPDNTYQISLDHRVINEGSLLADFTPAVNPPREIDDPTDTKPLDFDEREKINDPDAVKPEDWDEDAPPQIPDQSTSKPEGWLDDEETMIPDTNAIKPDDWDVEIDGEWEAPLVSNPICEKAVGCGYWKAPLISNPSYKGKWRAPLIDNPNYQGKWAPRLIPNPDFYEDLEPFKMTTIAAVGIELWSMSSDILFDNIIITSDRDVADDWAAQTFDIKRKQIDKEADTLWERAMRYMNYKPGYWALYFFYCSIPVSIYIWYLSQRAKEETFITRMINLTNENPYLYAVFVVVIGLPIAFLVYYFCSTSTKDKPVSYKKKSDDYEEEDNNDNVTDELLNSQENKKKSDLDEPIESVNDDGVEENDEYIEEDGESETENLQDSPVDDDNLPQQSTKPTDATAAAADGVKKRKARKE